MLGTSAPKAGPCGKRVIGTDAHAILGIAKYLGSDEIPLLGAHVVAVRCALVLQRRLRHVSAPPLQATLPAHLLRPATAFP